MHCDGIPGSVKLLSLLPALRAALARPGEFTVVPLTDNASTDVGAQLARAQFPRLKVIWMPLTAAIKGSRIDRISLASPTAVASGYLLLARRPL